MPHAARVSRVLLRRAMAVPWNWGGHVTSQSDRPVISVMLAVSDAAAAAAWYARALGAGELWNLGSVVGLEIAGVPFLLGEPDDNGWNTPERWGCRQSGSKCSATTLTRSWSVLSRQGRELVARASGSIRCPGAHIGRAALPTRSGTSGSSATGRHSLAVHDRHRRERLSGYTGGVG